MREQRDLARSALEQFPRLELRRERQKTSLGVWASDELYTHRQTVDVGCRNGHCGQSDQTPRRGEREQTTWNVDRLILDTHPTAEQGRCRKGNRRQRNEIDRTQ